MIVDCLAHVHSSFSYDSPTDLADIAATARRHGIGCVLVSEHNNTLDAGSVAALVERCDRLSTEACLLVPGLELSLDDNRIHLLAYGVREFIPSLTENALPPLVRRIHALGGVAVLAHPAHKAAYRRISQQDLSGLDGMEVWNVRNGTRYCPHADEFLAVRRLRRQGVQMAAFAGLDWHFLSHFERLTLRVTVARLTAEHVLDELKAGRFSIHGRFVSFAQGDDPGLARQTAYTVATRTVVPLRRAAYRWQARLERRGLVMPQAIIGIARRIF
jgi:hypothetical protein